MQRRTTPSDVEKTVARLNEALHTEHWRNPDRPDARLVKNRGGRPPEIVKAQGRIRTAAWRNNLDRRCAPTNAQIGQALVLALVTSSFDDLTQADRGIVGRALVDLNARGFSVREAQGMLRRLRNRLVDPVDREGEAGDKTAEPLVSIAYGEAAKMPF